MTHWQFLSFAVGLMLVALPGCDREQATDCTALIDKLASLDDDKPSADGDGGEPSVDWRSPMIRSCRETDTLESYGRTIDCIMGASSKSEAERCPKYREMTRKWARAMAKRRFRNVKFRDREDGG